MADISPTVYSGPYAAIAGQTDFPFTFSIVDAADLAVLVDGVAAGTGAYTVTFGETDGTVHFTAPPGAGASILILSDPDLLQASEFEDGGAYSLSTVNLINRRNAVRDLVATARANRALKVPLNETGPEIPDQADRAGKLLGFDAAGKPSMTVVEDAIAAAVDGVHEALDEDVAASQAARDAAAASRDMAHRWAQLTSGQADPANFPGEKSAYQYAVQAQAARDTAVAAATDPGVVAVAANLAGANTIGTVAGIAGAVSQAATDHAAIVAVAADLANIDAATNNLPAINAVTAAAATLGVYPNSAGVGGNIPRGVISFALTSGGSGGTNSTNNLVTFTGGALTSNPQMFYDVVGGVVTNVRMTFPGLYIGASAPTAPTASFPNGAGSPSMTLATGRLYNPGQGYWAVSADGRTLDRIANSGGVATADATVPSVYLKPAVDTTADTLLANSIKSALGSGYTLKLALFEQGPKGFSSSGNLLTVTSIEGNGIVFNANNQSFLFNGSEKYVVYDGTGIVFPRAAGLEYNNTILTKVTNCGIFWSTQFIVPNFVMNTTKAAALAAVAAAPTTYPQGTIIQVTGDSNVANPAPRDVYDTTDCGYEYAASGNGIYI